MVFVNNKKFACESCIKGHRSSSCTHPDRPLFEVKKKGRPVSQCEKCRELRQSRRVHSKCTCNDKATPSRASAQASSSGTKSKPRFIPIEPALPNGLKDIFQASSAIPPADIRQKVEDLLNPCKCKAKSTRGCQCGKQQAHGNADTTQPSEPNLLTLARAAAMRRNGDSADGSSSSSGKLQGMSKRVASRPSTPPASGHKRVKSVVSDIQPRLELPPIVSPLPSTPFPPSLPSFPTMPPLSAVASLAGSGCCNHCVDPTLVALPGSSTSSSKSIIDQFFARAASLPQPPSSRRLGGSATLDPMNTTVYPSTAHGTDERGVAFGLVNLPKLECCGGNCGCPNGLCGCGQACNGSCREHQSSLTVDDTQPIPRDEVTLSNSQAKTPEPTKPIRSCCAGR
ncbi:Copper-fist domain-containing protein [Pleurotus pulmonarius]